MRSLVVVALVAIVACVYAQTCDPTQGLGFNPACTSLDTPLCRMTINSTTPAYTCVACQFHCDCKAGQYCTSAPSSVGTCVDFDREGQDCLPLSALQIRDLPNAFLDSQKCAITYNDAGGNKQIDVLGACLNKVCRLCDPLSGGSFPALGFCPSTAIGGQKTCVFPGKLSTDHSQNWTPGTYYENPENVWWAIFFVFILIMCIMQCISTALIAKARRG